jgi:uncharacterized membrane protein
MMMNYMKSVKQTFINFYNENKTLSAIIIGAIGFPLALAVVGGVMALVIAILSIFFGQFYALVVFLMMVVGGIGGYIWSR